MRTNQSWLIHEDKSRREEAATLFLLKQKLDDFVFRSDIVLDVVIMVKPVADS